MGRARGHDRAATEGSRPRSETRLTMEQSIEAELAVADRTAPRAQSASAVNPFHPHSNEDRVLCDPERGVIAIFDGMGGADGGELAARAACGALTGELDYLPADDMERERWLADAVSQSANAVLLSRRVHQISAPKQSTTGLVACLAGENLLLASAGDSRAYSVAEDGRVRRLNWEPDAQHNPELRAQLEALDQVDSHADLQDPELMMMFARRHILSEDLPGIGRPQVERHPVSPGELVVLCSDGVSDNLTSNELATVIASERANGPQAVAEALVAAASARAEQAHVRAKPDDVTAACLIV